MKISYVIPGPISQSPLAYPVPRKVAAGSRLSSLLGGYGVSR
jgi:hypothetical protein